MLCYPIIHSLTSKKKKQTFDFWENMGKESKLFYKIWIFLNWGP